MLKKIKKILLLVSTGLSILFLIGFLICTVLLTVKALRDDLLTTLNQNTLTLTALLLLIPVAIHLIITHLLTCFGLIILKRKLELTLIITHVILAITTAICMVYQKTLPIVSVTTLVTIGVLVWEFGEFYSFYKLQ